MISLAKFQSETNLFAGLNVNYTTKTTTKKGAGKKQVATAILGGGDIAFPLLFSVAVLNHLLEQGIGMPNALYLTLIIAATATISLAALLFGAKKDHFYPAMPFLAAGCFIGLGIILLAI